MERVYQFALDLMTPVTVKGRRSLIEVTGRFKYAQFACIGGARLSVVSRGWVL